VTTAEQLLADLEAAAEDLLKCGEHEGICTNAHQMKLLPAVAPCRKHESAMRAREQRFRQALESFKVLRDVFGPQGI